MHTISRNPPLRMHDQCLGDTPAHPPEKRWFRLLLALVLLLASVAGAQAQTPVWIGFQVQGDTAYLLRRSPSEIMRYDLSAQQWLPPLALTEIPSAFAVGTNHIYVASDRKIERLSLSGTDKTLVATAPDTVSALFLDGNLLIANRSSGLYSRFSSYSTSNNALIDTHEDYPHGMEGASHSASANRIFGRTAGISPSDIDTLTYDDSGNFQQQADSPYHGDYPSASRTWSWPDGSKVVDNSGTVYVGADLSYAGTLPHNITDVSFVGADVPVVLRDGQVFAFNQALIETGRVSLALPARNITIRGDALFAFSEDPASPTRVGVQPIALSSLSPVQPGTPVSPVGLEYTVTSSAVDDAGILYLLSKPNSSIFRWDLGTQKYLSTIPLPETGDSIVFSRAHNALILLGVERTLYRIPLDGNPASIAALVRAPAQANLVIPMGQDLLVAANGSWGLQWVYSSTGSLLNSGFACCYLRFHFFDAPRSRLFVDSSHLAYLGNGQFSGSPYGPYLSDYQPLGLSPDGQRILNRDGVLYQASPLQPIDNLPNAVVAVEWADASRMLTVRRPVPGLGDRTELQRWSPYLTLETRAYLPGSHVALHKSGNRLVQVTQVAGRPRFHVFDTALALAAPAILDAPTLQLEAAGPLAVGVRWSEVQGAAGYDVERRQLGQVEWTRLGSVGYDASQFIDVDQHSGRQLQYRSRARNGTVLSEWSNIVAVDLSGATAPPPVDPNLVSFSPDDALIGNDDRIYLLSRQHRSVFVWNPRYQRFERSISLRGEPLYITYSQTRDVLFTGYENRDIYALSPKAPIPYEFPFAIGIGGLCGLTAADDLLVACDYSGVSASTYTYDLQGRRLGVHEWQHPVAESVWDPSRRRAYHFRDGISPNDLLYTPIGMDGTIGAVVDSPYHTSTGIEYPIRVSPSGTRVVLGSGYVFDADTLNHLGTLSSPMIDAAWLSNELITLRTDGLYWQPSELAAAERVGEVIGVGKRIFATRSGKLVTVMVRNGTTELKVYDGEFQQVAPPLFADGFD